LLLYLLGIKTTKELESSSLLGNIFETLVLGQIIRNLENKGIKPDLYFYRDHYGHEVDFVIPVGEKLKLFEAKWSSSNSEQIKGFVEIEKLLGEDKILSRTIITSQPGFYKTKENLFFSDPVDLRCQVWEIFF